MTRKLIHCLLIASLVLGLGLISASFGSAEEPVKIGYLVPVTGPSARVGEDFAKVGEIVEDEINKAGGVLGGRPVKLIVEDTESRPKAGIDAAHKLVEVDNVVVVTGIYSSGVGLPVGEYLNEVGVPYIANCTTTKMREIGPWVFDVAGIATHRSPPLVDFAVKDSGQKKFAMLFQDNPIGRSDGVTARKRVEELGGEVLIEIYYKMYKKDYRAELMKLMGTNPPAVIYEAYAREARIQMKQLFEMGYKDRSNWYTFELAGVSATSIPETVEGMKGVSLAVASLRAEHLYEEFERRYGKEPISPYVAPFYDSVWMAAIAINHAGSLDREKIREALYPVSTYYYGATGLGERGFDEDGMQAGESFQTQIYKNGKVQAHVGKGMTKAFVRGQLKPIKFYEELKE